MFKSSICSRTALALAAGALALGAAIPASAQSYGNGGGYANGYSNYDPCRRDANGRGVLGALVGGGLGAVVGSQFAGNGHRRDGSLLGGVVGALGGAAVGNNTAACTNAPQGPPPVVVRDAPPPPPPPLASNEYLAPPPPYPEAPYGRHRHYDRDREANASDDGCALADSPIYMPDGTVQKRLVRVCRDANGQYQPVN